MIRINFFGDFRIRDVSHLIFGDELQELLNSGDINLLNFEAPVFVDGAKEIHKSGPNLYQDPDAPRFLQDHGFNVISLANNHTLDYGEIAAVETIKSFDKAITLGCGTWNEAFQVKVLDVKGMKIGFLAITQHEFGAFGDQFYDKSNVGTASMSHPLIDELIVQSRDQVDHLFVVPHAGMEYCLQPLPEVVTLYRHFINMGASGVIGGHPHVPQPWERYKDYPIFYSLGNFCFDLSFPDNKVPEHWHSSVIASLLIDDSTVGVELHGTSYNTQTNVVNLCDKDKDFDSLMKSVCSDFCDKERYKSAISSHVKSMVASYEYGFSANGFFKFGVQQYFRLLMSFFYRKLPGLKQRQFDSSHLLNDFQCEVHRWAIQHLLKNNSL